jgi:hypothetical protein
MDVFELREKVVADYEAFVTSFMQARDPRVKEVVDEELAKGLLWPEPRIALNPAFAGGGWVDELVARGVLHPTCGQVCRLDKGQPEERGLMNSEANWLMDRLHPPGAHPAPRSASLPT